MVAVLESDDVIASATVCALADAEEVAIKVKVVEVERDEAADSATVALAVVVAELTAVAVREVMDRVVVVATLAATTLEVDDCTVLADRAEVIAATLIEEVLASCVD